MRTGFSRCLGMLGLAILPALLLSQPVLATEYFVSPTAGNDANPGTSKESPLRTFQAGDKKLVAGDTLTLLDGTYPAVAITRSGTPAAWITVRARNARKAVISLAAGWYDENSRCVDLAHVAYVKVIGLTVVGCAAADHTVVGAQHGISINGSHHILIQNCRVKDCSGAGIGGYDKYWDKNGMQSGPLDFITIEGNEISGCAFWCKYLSSGISMCNARDAGLGRDPSGYNFVIRNNLCYANENKIGEYSKNIHDTGSATDGNGIIIDYFEPNHHYPYKVLVEGNVVFDNGGRGIHVFNSRNTTIRYNTCWHNNRNKLDYSTTHDQGDLSVVFSKNVDIHDNLVVASTNAWSAVVGLGGATNVRIINNLLNGTKFLDPNHSVNVTEKGTLTADPKLVNPSTHPAVANFRLQAGSPAIDAADATPAPARDCAGTRRPQGRANDLGAYEYPLGPVLPRSTGPSAR